MRGDQLPMKAYALTNIGKVRAVNEDAHYLPRPGERFAAVADGMGGHLAGEVASALAIEVFSSRLRGAVKPNEDTLTEAVEAANRAIYEQSMTDRAKRGMGTTLTALCFTDDCVFLSHVGDSRAYLLRNRAMIQLSSDHSLVNELVEKGEITPREARVHPQRNLITRALGTAKRVTPDITRLDPQDRDAWLLCSDGLSNYLYTHELAHIMMQNADWPDKLKAMIDLALARGGADNITAMIVLAEEGAR